MRRCARCENRYRTTLRGRMQAEVGSARPLEQRRSSGGIFTSSPCAACSKTLPFGTPLSRQCFKTYPFWNGLFIKGDFLGTRFARSSRAAASRFFLRCSSLLQRSRSTELFYIVVHFHRCRFHAPDPAGCGGLFLVTLGDRRSHDHNWSEPRRKSCFALGVLLLAAPTRVQQMPERP